MSQLTSPPADLLPWDTEFFGFRIGRLRSGRFDPDAVKAWQEENRIRCLYYLAEMGDSPSIHAAESMGFRLMDVRTTFFLQLPKSADLKSDFIIRQAIPDDLPKILHFTTGIFAHARFYQDANFPTPLVDKMYNRWLEKHFQQENTCVWVGEDESGILGFTSIETTPDGIARLSLTGVNPSARRRGLAKAIKNHIIDFYSRSGFSGLESITQGCNRSLININFSFGFKLVSQQLWLHGWF